MPGALWFLLAIVLKPGDPVGAIVARAPEGATFRLRAGVHRMQSIEPKDRQSFIGEPGAVLNGSRLLTSFEREGAWWVASGQRQRGRRAGQCDAAHPRCSFPEDLFLDDQPLHHAASLEALRPGEWFFDYDAGKIYLADDPRGRKVETSVTPHAFYGAARNVTIRGLVIEKYATPAQAGAVHGKAEPHPQSKGWVVEDNEIRLNHGGGIRLGDSMKIVGNRIHHNGQIGIIGGGSGIMVAANVIAHNNTLGFDHEWEGGGAKFVRAEDLTVRDNQVHDNLGPGLWTDGQNRGVLYEGNRVARNITGIFHEISYDAVIRNNIVESNGLTLPAKKSSLWYTAGILIAASSNVEVCGNVLVNNRNGIGATQIQRGAGERGPFETRNLRVYENTVSQRGGVAAGLVESGYGSTVFKDWNNRFETNTYRLESASFEWAGATMRHAQWQKHGHDRAAPPNAGEGKSKPPNGRTK